MKLHKIVFGLSILFIIFALVTLVSSVRELAYSYGHNILDVGSVFGFLSALGIFLGIVSLSVVTHFYIKNPILTSKFSNISIVLSGIVLLFILIWKFIIFALLIASGGLLAFIPGIFSLPSFVIEIYLAVCILIFIGLALSYIKTSNRRIAKSIFFGLVVLLIVIPWYGTRIFAVKNVFLGAKEKVTAIGITNDWRSYENSQTGISFKYPPSWPVATHGLRGAEDPYYIDFQEPRKPKVANIEIGQMTSDGVTCSDCVPVSPEQITQYLTGMIEYYSPDEKFTVNELYINEKKYISYSIGGPEGKNSWIIVPNPVTPNLYAIVKFQTPLDENTKYLFIDSFEFKTPKGEGSSVASQDMGYIQGKLGYPSNTSPLQTVCASEIKNNHTVCTTEQDLVSNTATCGLGDWEKHIGEIIEDGEVSCRVGLKSYTGYKIKVPVGEYHVYSTLAGDSTNLKAFYSENVTCGLGAQCLSHKPIVIKVLENQITSGVDPVDWYNPSAISTSTIGYKNLTTGSIDKLKTGDMVRFSWKGCNLTGNKINLNFVMYIEGSPHKTRSHMITDVVKLPGIFDLQIPNNIESGAYKVYLNIEGCVSGYYGMVLNVEQTQKPNVTFISPVESESIKSGESYKIRWVSDSEGTFDIGYSGTGTDYEYNKVVWIVKGLKNKSEFEWLVPVELAKSGWTHLVIRDVLKHEIISSPAFLIY